MEATEATNPAPLAANKVVEGEWQCIACEYPLRGLDPCGACPECGTKLSLSLRDDRLAHSSPFWLIHTSQGATLLCFVAAATFVFTLIFSPILNLGHDSPFWHLTARFNSLSQVLAWLAVWILATPEYVAAGLFRYRLVCWAMRGVMIARMMVHEAKYVNFTWSRSLYVIDSFVEIALITLIWLYLRILSRRIPDLTMLRNATIVMVCLIVSEFLSNTIYYFNRAFSMHIAMPPPNVVSLIALVTTAFQVYVLAQFSTRLTTSANQAMTNYLSER
jgi:hypothetical protein